RPPPPPPAALVPPLPPGCSSAIPAPAPGSDRPAAVTQQPARLGPPSRIPRERRRDNRRAGAPGDRVRSRALVRRSTLATPLSPIWRGGCQGVGVVGHCLVGVWSAVVAARGAGRAAAGSRRVVMLIFGGWVPQDLCSSHVRCLKSSAAPGWALLRRQIAELLCASRGCSGRLASRNGNVDSG